MSFQSLDSVVEPICAGKPPLGTTPPKCTLPSILLQSHPLMITHELSGIEEEPPTPIETPSASKFDISVKKPSLSIVPAEDVRFELLSDEDNGSTTAPIVAGEGFDTMRGRFFSFGNANVSRPHLGSTASSARRHRYSRQNTVGGGDSALTRLEFAPMFHRAISRTYTLTSTASSSIPVEEWRPIFDKLDLESDGIVDGKIPMNKFREILEDDPIWMETVPPDVQEKILNTVDKNNDGVIDYDEFIELVKGNEFGFGRHKRRAFRELLKQTAEFIVPYKYSYQNQYSCSPPPVFMVAISLLQVIIFTYNSAVMFKEIGYIGVNGPVPYCSNLIYNPDKRHQIWRYITYMFIHAGLFHVIFNVLVQLVLGIPLEMVHGWWRVMLVYVSGVLAGSLWTSVIRPSVYLSGASGGVYALITAHLGTVIMNFREMTCPWTRIFVVCIVTFTDVIVYIYDTYIVGHENPISYPAHISGAATGLLVGITCLKNLRWETHERYIWAFSVFTFVILMLVAIVWNVAFPSHFPGLSFPVPCVSEHVL